MGILPSKPRLHNESKNKLTVRVLNIKKKPVVRGAWKQTLHTPQCELNEGTEAISTTSGTSK